MMTQPFAEQEQESFQHLLEELYNKSDQTDILSKVRAKAWDHFLDLGLPTKRDEVFRYIRLRSFFANNYVLGTLTQVTSQDIAPHVLPECSQSLLVFVNGHFASSLSQLDALPKKVVISSLSEAMRTYSGFINSQWSKTLKEETDPFATLNAALHGNGLFLYLPPKVIAEQPIQVLNVIDAQLEAMLMMPRLHVFAGSQSQLSIVSTQAHLSGKEYAMNMTADFAIEEDAHVRYTQIACGAPEEIWHFDALRAVLKRNSTLKTVAVTDGSATVRHDYRVMLAGENAEALLNGVWMLNGKREAHAHVLMDHQAPYCRSMQLFKGALNDFSRSSFEGKILVRQAAQKTEAFQLNNNLLLSDRANADSKPNLEIFADDVKASHGSTVGQLDQEQIFYMKTRGFTDSAAKNLLVHGFCQEVIDLIPVDSLRSKMSERAQNYLV